MKLPTPPEDPRDDQIFRHPGFNTAHRAFLLEYNIFQTDTPRANRILDNQARVILCNCILHLHFRHLYGCGRFPTPGRLQSMMEELGLYSARGVDLALSELRAARFVTIDTNCEDRRVSQVVPTPELIAFYRSYAHLPLAALDRLKTRKHYVASFEQIPELFDYMSLIAGQHPAKTITPMRHPDTFAIMQHTGGYRLLTELLAMASAVNLDAPDQVLLHLCLDTVSTHCHISRSQTRLLLDEALQAGLITHDRRAVYRVSKLLVQTFVTHFAQILRHMEYNFDAAVSELNRRRALTLNRLGGGGPAPPGPSSSEPFLPLRCETSRMRPHPH
jgi:hypothetical protein